MYSIDKGLKTPLYIQVYENIKNSIEIEKLAEGERLPSIRSLAKKLEVNNVTVVNAYKLLEEEGYTYSLKGSGTYVRPSHYNIDMDFIDNRDLELMTGGVISMDRANIDLSSVSPSPSIFPIDDFKEALIEVLDRDRGLAFAYPEINGYEPLRESISHFIRDNYDIEIDKKYIQIISGGQQGIDIITKTLVSPGDHVFVENPTYSGALSAFKSRGAKIVGIPMNKDGIDIDILREYIKKYNPKLLYLMTNFQSPTTYSYSESVKDELIALSRDNNFYIIEDDFLTDISFHKPRYPLKSKDIHKRVIYIKSFSKSFMPGVRIAFMTMTEDLLPSIVRAKHSTDISSSAFLQRAFDLYLRKGYWNSYMEKVNTLYEKKYRLMLAELSRLEKYNIYAYKPSGGLSLWLELPDPIDSLRLYEECDRNKLSISPGDPFFVDDTVSSNYIRLSFSQASDEDIIKGIEILEESIKSVLKG